MPAALAPGDDTDHGPLLGGTMTVATWNLWWRFGPWQERAAAIEATLRAVDADIVCLQEVWKEGDRDQAGELGSALGLASVYATGVDFDGVHFGNAVLSRWPIAGHEVLRLPSPPELDEGRVALRADIEAPHGPVQVFCTHLHWRFDHSAIRQDQVRELAAFVRGSPPRTYPPVVAGDFNAPPDSDEIRMMTGRATVPEANLVFFDAWEVGGDGGGGVTWSNGNPHAARALEPERRLDYVFAGWPKAGGAGHVVRAAVFGTDEAPGLDGVPIVPSDHYGVVATLRC